ncbi:unnamed protein product [Amoebophrya sp. A25]|nr:unnamed protein product [Amoebophrya sp. A25]|eukprot:GSA25T00006938001.1
MLVVIHLRKTFPRATGVRDIGIAKACDMHPDGSAEHTPVEQQNSVADSYANSCSTCAKFSH